MKETAACSTPGTPATVADRARHKLSLLHHSHWLAEFVRPRPSRYIKKRLKNEGEEEQEEEAEEEENENNSARVDENEDSAQQLEKSADFGDSEDENDGSYEQEKLSKQSRTVKRKLRAKPQESPSGKKSRKKRKARLITTEECDPTPPATRATNNSTAKETPKTGDNLELFGQYVTSKMRKLSQCLTEEAMENVEFSIITILMQARSSQDENNYLVLENQSS